MILFTTSSFQAAQPRQPWFRALRLALLLPLLGDWNAATAQAPVITRLAPTRNAIAAPRTATIVASFDQPLRNYDGWSGELEIFSQQTRKSASVGVRNNTVYYNPDFDFKAGETVFATVTTAVQSSSGQNLAAPQVFQFTTATTPSAGTFSGGSYLTVGGIPRDLITGDVDGDGDLDLLTANYTNYGIAGTVSVLFNSGNGSFSRGPEIPVGARTVALALGDLDRDGDLDLVVANISAALPDAGQVSVRLNDGNGAFSGSQEVAVSGEPCAIALGDVDGDGDLDFITANQTGRNPASTARSISIRFNDGSGSFIGQQDLPVADVLTSVAVGDLDSDGDLDLLATNISKNTVSTQFNDGSGNFAAHQEVSVGATPQKVVLGDIDADGDLDFMTTNQTSNTSSIRRNDGTGVFSGSQEVEVGPLPYGLALGDVDGDGDLDLLAGNIFKASGPATATVQVRLNDGAGSFSGVQQALPTTSHYPTSIVLADIDNDGDLDVATAYFNDKDVVVLFNQPMPSALAVTALSPARNALAVPRETEITATFNRPLSDNSATLQALKVFSRQAGGRKAGTVTVSGNTLRFKPDTNFKAGETAFVSLTSAAQSSSDAATPQVFQFTTATTPSAGTFRGGSDVAGTTIGVVAVGDVDGDGDLDLLTTLGSSVGIRLNNGLGNYSTGSQVSVNNYSQDLALGDVDGDGNLDLVTVNGYGNIASVRLNDGAGNFRFGQDVAVGSDDDYASRVTLADLDGDGDLDLLVANYSNSSVSIHLNNGVGIFRGSQKVAVTRNPFSLVVGDVDNDGDVDLVTSSSNSQVDTSTGSSGTASVRYNNGAGYFFAGQEVMNLGVAPTVALGDVDGDGDLDLVAANYTSSGSANVRLNDGRGSFSGNQQISLGYYPTDLDLGDIDGDGDLDLVVNSLGGGSGNVSVRFNNGTGTFGGTQEVAVKGYSGIVLADLNGDGTLDFVTGGGSVRLNQVAPVISSLSPRPNAVAVPLNAAVVATFTQPLNDGPTTRNGLKVFSQQTGGLKAGTGAVSGSTLSFTPTTTFRAGETVFASQTSAVQTSANSNPAQPYVFQFTTATVTSPGLFGGGTDPSVESGPAEVKTADVDGDGDLDLLTVNSNATVSVRLNNGTGSYGGGQEVAIPGRLRGLSVGDVDGDGDLDLLVTNGLTNTVQVRLNNGTGLFSGSQQTTVGRDPAAITIGDVDGDGDLDVLAANYSSSSVSIRLNNGLGTFSGGSEVAVGTQPLGLVVGDIDNDGDLDLLTATSNRNTVSVRFNNGTGAFSGSQELPVSFNPYSLGLGDIDGDGDLDLLAANLNNYSGGQFTNSTVSVRLNDGSGTFTGTQEVVVGRGASSLALGDVDGDADLDFVVANYGNWGASSGTTSSVRLNNGSGLFSGTQEVSVGSQPASVVLGDVDGNGTLDLVTANTLGNTVSVRLNQALLPAVSTYRLNAGGATLATSVGLFATDQYYSASSETYATSAAIAGTLDDALYQSERYSTNGQLRYAVPVANGTYRVVLHFAEIYWTQAGQRVFNIVLENTTVLSNYDIVAKVGPLTATTETFMVTVTDGVLNLDLVVPYQSGGRDQAKLAALEVLPATSTYGALTPLATASPPRSVEPQAYPNPVTNGRFMLAYTAATAQASTLTLLDQLGRTVHKQTVQLHAGPNQVAVQPALLQAGLYQLVVRTADGQRSTQKVVVQP